jgi:deoxyribonuclease I
MSKHFKYSLLILPLLLITTMLWAAHPTSFQEAKKQARIIWSHHPETVYCGCKFDKRLNINHKSCGYLPGRTPRAYKVEWEHIVPVSWFGRQRACWRELICEKDNGKKYKGRDCCERVDPEFRKMYTYLHNLIPVIGEVNQARHNYRFGEFNIKGKWERYNFHGCKIIIDGSHRIVEPRNEAKGLVARANLYMMQTYKLKLSPKQKQMFNRWNKSYPPSAWELEWNNRVKDVQGNDNAYITEYTQKNIK